MSNELEARWGIFKENGKFQLRKLQADGSPGEAVGKPHDTRKDARMHQKALYVNSPDMTGSDSDAQNYRLSDGGGKSCATCIHLDGLECKLYNFIVKQDYTCDSQETTMEVNTLAATIKFEADEQNPRFLRFKDAVLARVETNKNNDKVDLAGIKQIAATIPFTHIDIEHDGKRNVGMFTAGRVSDSGELLVDGVVWLDACEALGIDAKDIADGRYKLSVEADAQTAECSVCHNIFQRASDYCGHLKDRFAHKAERFLQGLKGVGGALTYRPAGSGTGFSQSSIMLLASSLHSEENMAEPITNTTVSTSGNVPVIMMAADPALVARIEALESAVSERKDVSEADKKRAESEASHFADTKNKKYKLDTEEEVRAAWSYVHMPKNRKFYSAEDLKTIEENIKRAGAKYNIDYSEDEKKNKEHSSMADKPDEKEVEDSPEEEKNEEEANYAEMKKKLEASMADMEKKHKEEMEAKDKEASELKSKLEAALGQMKASELANLKSRFIAANVMTAEEFDAQAETVLATDKGMIELLLKGKPQPKNDPLRLAGELQPEPSKDGKWY